MKTQRIIKCSKRERQNNRIRKKPGNPGIIFMFSNYFRRVCKARDSMSYKTEFISDEDNNLKKMVIKQSNSYNLYRGIKLYAIYSQQLIRQKNTELKLKINSRYYSVNVYNGNIYTKLVTNYSYKKRRKGNDNGKIKKKSWIIF